MAKKRIFYVIRKQYGKETFKNIYAFTSRLAAAKHMVKLHDEAEKRGDYVSTVHFCKWGRYTVYNPLNMDSFHVSCRHCNEQYVELVSKFEGEPLEV